LDSPEIGDPPAPGTGQHARTVVRGPWPVFASLSFPDYRLLWVCVAAANSGRWILALGVGWLLFSLTHSSFWVGASFFTIQGPALIVAPLAGVWADRHDRRHLLAFALALAAAATGTLAVLTLLHHAGVLSILACTLTCGIALSIRGTAGSSLVPALVPRDTLPNAVALQGTVQQGAEFIGPLLASPLLVAFGPGAVFGLACLCYAAAIPLSLRIAPRQLPRRFATRYAFGPLLEGVRYLRRSPLLGSIVLLVGFHCSLTMTYQGMLPQFTQGMMDGGGAYGGTMTMIGLGAIAGTLALAAVSDRRWHSTGYAVTAVASGGMLVLLGLTSNYLVAFALSFAVGAAQATLMALSLTFLQQLTDPAYLGRVTGVYSFLAGGAMAFTSWGFGALAAITSPTAIMVGAGSAFVLVVAVAALRSPAFRRLCRADALPLHVPEYGVSALV